MNTSTISPLFLIVAIMCPGAVSEAAQAAKTANHNRADEAAIRENVLQMETGWNTRQGSLFAQPFAEDADYVVINGRYIKGRTIIEKEHQRIFDTIYKNTTIQLSVQHIRFLNSDVAVVHVSGHRSASESETDLGNDAFITMVMTKVKDAWKIAAFQNTQVAKTNK